MIRQTLFVPLAASLLALACAQAIAAPTPYSNFVVFGDSLNDAGQFTDPAFMAALCSEESEEGQGAEPSEACYLAPH